MTSPASRSRILLVDDNADNLLLLRLFLDDGPYEVHCAENGGLAVELFATTPYDLVLMDLEMPVLDGYEATRAIRDLERRRQTRPVPILALTAYDLDECQLRSRQAGCTAFLVKPVGREALLETLDRHLREAGVAEPAGADDLADVVWDTPDREFLRPILPVFFDTAGQTLDMARQALAAQDLEAVRRQGHKLKGSALSYGFTELGEAGRDLEAAARDGQAATAAALLDRAGTLLARARRILA